MLSTPVTGLQKKSFRSKLTSRKPKLVDVHIGNRLRERRMLAGLSQEELAEGIGVGFQQIQKYEHAINRIGISRLWDLSVVLQCPIMYFFEAMDRKTLTAGRRRFHGDIPIEANLPPDEAYPAPAQRNPASTNETLKLVRAYSTIKKQSMRRQILELATTISALSPSSDHPQPSRREQCI